MLFEFIKEPLDMVLDLDYPTPDLVGYIDWTKNIWGVFYRNYMLHTLFIYW